MTLSWSSFEFFIRHPNRIPNGFTLSYEFRPSLTPYPNIHTVHEFWKRRNPDQLASDFWGLSVEEQKQWKDRYLTNYYTTWSGIRPPYNFLWQRFTLVDPNGTEFILEMNSTGNVRQVKRQLVVVEVIA